VGQHDFFQFQLGRIKLSFIRKTSPRVKSSLPAEKKMFTQGGVKFKRRVGKVNFLVNFKNVTVVRLFI
jgi:hypothetical protein